MTTNITTYENIFHEREFLIKRWNVRSWNEFFVILFLFIYIYCIFSFKIIFKAFCLTCDVKTRYKYVNCFHELCGSCCQIDCHSFPSYAKNAGPKRCPKVVAQVVREHRITYWHGQTKTFQRKPIFLKNLHDIIQSPATITSSTSTYQPDNNASTNGVLIPGSRRTGWFLWGTRTTQSMLFVDVDGETGILDRSVRQARCLIIYVHFVRMHH